jgi:hypothetical protein
MFGSGAIDRLEQGVTNGDKMAACRRSSSRPKAGDHYGYAGVRRMSRQVSACHMSIGYRPGATGWMTRRPHVVPPSLCLKSADAGRRRVGVQGSVQENNNDNALSALAIACDGRQFTGFARNADTGIRLSFRLPVRHRPRQRRRSRRSFDLLLQPASMSRLKGTQMTSGLSILLPDGEYEDKGSRDVFGNPVSGGCRLWPVRGCVRRLRGKELRRQR